VINRQGTKLEVLRTDNELEFVLEEFNDSCKARGIKRHKMVASTPQQNGLAKRMNKIILERVTCMLLGAGLPKSFWGKAAKTAIYLIRKSPSSTLNNKTPMEVLSRRPTNYENLRVFGTLAFEHIKKAKLEACHGLRDVSSLTLNHV